jgi:hypothetical protein
MGKRNTTTIKDWLLNHINDTVTLKDLLIKIRIPKQKTPFRKGGRANIKAEISLEYTLLLVQISLQYNLQNSLATS